MVTLTRLDPNKATPQQVFDAVSYAHHQTPDPKVNGNAGSFLKTCCLLKLLTRCWRNFQQPHITPVDGSVKLAAGWLIDQCQLKGTQIGGAGCTPSTGAGSHKMSTMQKAKMLYSWRTHVRQKSG